MTVNTETLLDKLYNLRGADSDILKEMERQKAKAEATKARTTDEKANLQKNIADLAEESVKINGLDDQIKIINADIKTYQTEEKFDLITCNPPYFKVTSLKNLNENQAKSIARHEITIDLETIIKISSKLLNDQGIFGLVHRPSRLIEIVNLCEKYSLEIKKIQFVYPRINEEANIVLIEAIKNGKSQLKVLEPIITSDGLEYTNQIKKYFE